MPESSPDSTPESDAAIVADAPDGDPRAVRAVPTAAGQAALARAQGLARQAAAAATLRAYKADWQHYADWCAGAGFCPVPAAPATVGAYLASLAESHARSTIRRRLAAIGKMHRFNDLPWNPGHRHIQEPLQGLLRRYGRPGQKAAALTLPLERAATRGFAGQAAAFVRAQNLRTALIAGGVLFGVAVLAGGGGYWWGHSTAKADIRQTETGLATAFANGPEAAREWWSLMAWNDPRKALANCKVRVDGGRRACDLPMWIEGPQAPGQGR